MVLNRLRDSSFIAIVFIITFALAYLLGTSILYLIDHKMNDISINMPKINIPSHMVGSTSYQAVDNQNISSNPAKYYSSNKKREQGEKTVVEPSKKVQLSKRPSRSLSDKDRRNNILKGKNLQLGGASGVVRSSNRNTISLNPDRQKIQPLKNKSKKNVVEAFQSTAADDTDVLEGIVPDQWLGIDQEQVDQSAEVANNLDTLNQGDGTQDINIDDTDIDQPCARDSDCNLIPGQQGNVCKINQRCHCLTGVGSLCNKSLTYYKDPVEMSLKQKLKFKAKAKLSKMTLQDYKNWLSMFRQDIQGMADEHPAHLKNFEKYLSGGEITLKDLEKAKEAVVELANLAAQKAAAAEAEEDARAEAAAAAATKARMIAEEEAADDPSMDKCGNRYADLKRSTGKGFSVFKGDTKTMYATYPGRFETS